MDYDRLGRIEVREGAQRQIKSYVLRSNVLSDKDRAVFDMYGDAYMAFYEDGRILDFRSLFGNDNPTVVEIGFGMGDSTLKIASERRDVNFLCLEVYLPGVTRLLRMVGEAGLQNVRIMRFNAVDVLENAVAEGSVHGFHIFFPDPWPKKKHHKRRLIQGDFVHLMSLRLEKGGYIYAVTDWQEYADQMLSVMDAESLLENPYGGFAKEISWRPTTKFERKGLDKDYSISEVWFVRK